MMYIMISALPPAAKQVAYLSSHQYFGDVLSFPGRS